MNSAQLRKHYGSGPFTGKKDEIGAFVSALPVSLNTASGPNGPAAFCLLIHLVGGESVEEAQDGCTTSLALETALALLENATIGTDTGLAVLFGEKLAGELAKPVDLGNVTIKPSPAKKKPKKPAKQPPKPGDKPPPLAVPPSPKSKSNTGATVAVAVGLSIAALAAGYFAWRTFRPAAG